jgi:hypothetical protein
MRRRGIASKERTLNAANNGGVEQEALGNALTPCGARFAQAGGIKRFASIR